MNKKVRNLGQVVATSSAMTMSRSFCSDELFQKLHFPEWVSERKGTNERKCSEFHQQPPEGKGGGYLQIMELASFSATIFPIINTGKLLDVLSKEKQADEKRTALPKKRGTTW